MANSKMSVLSAPENDRLMERWRTFFKVVERYPKEKQSLFAMGKLTQIALVNYMHLRGAYTEDIFVKRRYEEFKFVTLNVSTEHGAKLDKIVHSIGQFINVSSLKALRFQLFHDPEKPQEIGEELQFLFHYGMKPRIEFDFGSGHKLDFDMSDCSFDNFLRSFASIIGKIKAYCVHLNPLPLCEKRFRTSFCKKVPANLMTEHFGAVFGAVQYAPEMLVKDVGTAGLSNAAIAAVLRTCYSTDEIDNAIAENLATMVQSEVNDVFGLGEKDSFLEVPRRLSDEVTYQNTLDERSLRETAFSPVQYPHEIPVQDTVVREEVVQEQALQVEEVPVYEEVVQEQVLQVDEVPPPMSPSLSNRTFVSFEAVMSPFDRQPLVHDNTDIIGTTRSKSSSSSDDDDSDKQLPRTKKNSSKNVQRPETRASRRAAEKEKEKQIAKEGGSSEEDSIMRQRKNLATKRKPSNKEAVEELGRSRPKRQRNY